MAMTSTHVEGDEFVYVNGWRPGATPPADVSMVATMAAVVRAARTMHGRDLAPTRAEVKHPQPRNLARFEGFFRCPLRFEAPEFVLAFRLADVERPVPGGHHRLAAAADAAVLDYLDTLRIDDEGGDVTRQVRDVLADAIAAGEPDVAAVASELAMSSRTLQRRLSDEGTDVPRRPRRHPSRPGDGVAPRPRTFRHRHRPPPRLQRNRRIHTSIPPLDRPLPDSVAPHPTNRRTATLATASARFAHGAVMST